MGKRSFRSAVLMTIESISERVERLEYIMADLIPTVNLLAGQVERLFEIVDKTFYGFHNLVQSQTALQSEQKRFSNDFYHWSKQSMHNFETFIGHFEAGLAQQEKALQVYQEQTDARLAQQEKALQVYQEQTDAQLAQQEKALQEYQEQMREERAQREAQLEANRAEYQEQMREERAQREAQLEANRAEWQAQLAQQEKALQVYQEQMREERAQREAQLAQQEKALQVYQEQMREERAQREAQLAQQEKALQEYQEQMREERAQREAQLAQQEKALQEYQEQMREERAQREAQLEANRAEWQAQLEADRADEAQRAQQFAAFIERTDKQLARIEENNKEIKRLQERMDERKIQWDRETRAYRQQMAELSDKMGTLVEDLVAPSIPGILQHIVKCSETPLMKGVRITKRHTHENRSKEYDVVVVCEDYILINETKSRMRPEYIPIFVQNLKDARNFFPEYAEKKIIGTMATLYMDPSLVVYGERQGLIMLGVIDGLLHVLNHEDFEPVYF
jgi:chemotaxis protein histidine kinase CheA